MIDWEGTQNRNYTEKSGSNFLQNTIKNVILVCVFVTCSNMLMSKAYKTEHKKNLATTFKTNGLVKFYLSSLQNKFHWCSVS